MNISALIADFAALGITVAQTPEGKLFATPRNLLTDELRERLKAAKAEIEAQDEQDTPPLRLLTSDDTPTGSPPYPAPVLEVVQGHQATPLYGIVGGIWQGPGIDALPWGRCNSCGWDGPMKTQGAEGQCALCWQADGRRAGQAHRCETFCERELEIPLRFEPGGILSCPDCTVKMLQIKDRAAQRVRPANVEMQQSG